MVGKIQKLFQTDCTVLKGVEKINITFQCVLSPADRTEEFDFLNFVFFLEERKFSFQFFQNIHFNVDNMVCWSSVIFLRF